MDLKFFLLWERNGKEKGTMICLCHQSLSSSPGAWWVLSVFLPVPFPQDLGAPFLEADHPHKAAASDYPENNDSIQF